MNTVFYCLVNGCCDKTVYDSSAVIAQLLRENVKLHGRDKFIIISRLPLVGPLRVSKRKKYGLNNLLSICRGLGKGKRKVVDYYDYSPQQSLYSTCTRYVIINRLTRDQVP